MEGYDKGGELRLGLELENLQALATSPMSIKHISKSHPLPVGNNLVVLGSLGSPFLGLLKQAVFSL